MKALKEKRVSLRSFLRRGLVILSLFALAFAFASCSESGGDDTPTGGGTTPTTPPAPQVKYMNVVVHPTNESYQGLPANLHGLVVEITKDDGSAPYFVREGDAEFANFFTAPCDEPWDRWAVHASGNTAKTEPYTKLKLGYKGTTLQAELRIPHIVPADRIEFFQASLPNWYADQRPKFDELQYKYNVIFEEGWDAWPNQYLSGDPAFPNPLQRLVGTMTTDYPKVDYVDATAVKKTLWIYIGDDVSTPAYQVNAAGQKVIKTSLKIDNYFEPWEVKFAGANWEQGGDGKGYFDDDVLLFFNANSTAHDTMKIIDQFIKSNVKFDIDYKGDNGAVVKQGLSMQDFVANSQWYYDQKNLGPGFGTGNYSTFMERIVYQTDEYSILPGNASVLNYGRDLQDDTLENAWRVYLQYAPITYGTIGGTDVAKVPVELYVFGEAEAKSLGELPWIERGTTTEAVFGAERDFRTIAANNRSEFEAIAYKWVLNGSYENSRLSPKNQSKDIALTKEMFYAGYAIASTKGMGSAANDIIPFMAAGSISVDAKILTQLGANNSMWNYSVNFQKNSSLTAGEFVTDFPLPFYYRESYSEDPEEGIAINVRY